MIRRLIGDGRWRSQRAAGITSDNAIPVTVVPRNAGDYTPEELTRIKYFTTYASDDAGSTDLAVDGSVTPQDFLIRPPMDELISIRELRFIFQDDRLNMASNEARRFGTAAGTAGLPNGLEAFIEQAGVRTDLIVEPINHMSEFFNYISDFFNIIDAIAVNVDLLVWVFDLKLLVPIPLPEAGKDRIVIRVNDDLTPMTSFQVLAVGQREPE